MSVDEIPLPGGRPRRKTSDERYAEAAEGTTWDSHPRVYRVGGEDREWFPISALATALDRKVTTIYSWERKGWFPKARVRSQRVDDIQGHRLYSRAFIEGVVKIAKQEGLFNRTKNGKAYPIEKTDFPERVAELMQEVHG